jgi:hypothetical protein
VETNLTTNAFVPDFRLADLQGRSYCLSDYRGRIVIVNFWSAECPWSTRADKDILTWLPAWGEKVAYFPIASNVNETPGMLAEAARQRKVPLLLRDVGAGLAELFGALTTPHVFVIDPAGVLRYQGAFDNFSFRQRAPSQHYLKEAVEALLSGRLPDLAETPPYGCTIIRHRS